MSHGTATDSTIQGCPHAAAAKAAAGSVPAVTESQREVIRAKILENQSRMTIQLARELGVPEVEVVRCLPDGNVWELDAARWEPLIRSFELLGDVHVIASNGSVTLECFGKFGNFSTWNDFFNVQTKSLDMHIRHNELVAAFAVQKPGHMDGVNTLSFQFFDRRGSASFKVFLTFGGDAPTPERVAQFKQVRDQFAKATV